MSLQEIINVYKMLPKKLQEVVSYHGLRLIKHLNEDTVPFNTLPEGSELIGINRDTGNFIAIDRQKRVRYYFRGARWIEAVTYKVPPEIREIQDLTDIYQLFKLHQYGKEELTYVISHLKAQGVII